MPTVLICAESGVERELGATLLFRSQIERYHSTRADQARLLTLAVRPDIVIVDRDLPRAVELVRDLRSDETARHRSVLVMARGDFEMAEVELLEAGANAIIRAPAGAEWDDRLERLMGVPVRRTLRFPIQFAIDALPPRGDTPTPALGLNVSIHGVLLESNEALVVGDEIGLLMRLPGDGKPVVARGWVVREASSTRFGVEFQRFAADDWERVTQFIDRYRTA